jgi:thioredoxin reductase
MSGHEQRSEQDERYDVVVVGGGAAGLSGAMTLARSRRSVLVVDAGQPRNAPAEGVHNYLGREGAAPGELLAAGREEVRRYGGAFQEGGVVAAERAGDGEDGFRLELADGGEVWAARLLVATGSADELPGVPGLAQLWGRDVLHCPYCHGWEARDRAIGVLATGPMAAHQALMWRQLSERVTLFRHTGPDLAEEDWERLAARGVAVVDGEVAAVETDGGGRLGGVRLAGGRVVPCEVLVVATRVTARVGFLAPLGLKPEEVEMGGQVVGSRVPADAMTGATEVPGVWVAGNVAGPMEQVIGSAAAGVRAGAAINADLIEEETRRAVAASR